jgi:hypothetical protein
VEEVYAVEEAREERIILTKMTEKENTAPDPREDGPSAVNFGALVLGLQVAAGEEQRCGAAENFGNMVIACTSHQHHIRLDSRVGEFTRWQGEESSVCEAEVNGFEQAQMM